MVRYIGISGKKQSGKDFSARLIRDILTNEAGVSHEFIHVFPFAKPLKDIAINALGIDEALIYGTNEDKETLTHVLWEGFPDEVREHYSIEEYPVGKIDPDASIPGDTYTLPVPRYGPMTIREVLQVMGTDIFRERVYQSVWAEAPFRQQWGEYDVVILPDCRFPDEKRIIEDHGGFVIRLDRHTGLDDSHPSETSLDRAEFNYHYVNNGSVEELKSFLKACLASEGIL